jgi:hypothetical protein
VPRSLPDPDALLDDAPLVWAALTAAGWSAAALDGLLGATARTHLDRDELAPLLRRTGGGSALEVVARLFVLGVGVDLKQAQRAGVPESWLVPDGFDVAAAVRLQPVVHGGVEVLVAHDPSRAADGVHPEQVLGVGAASLTLAAATPRAVVGRTLDLGTGSGIQALLAEDHSGSVVATDASARATAYTRLSAALNGQRIDVRTGDLLEPVRGELFDLVVSNPPFVIGPGSRYTYRDGGRDADDLCRSLVAGLPRHLTGEGTAVLLANWLHVEGEDGDERVQSWFGDDVDGWVVQRELAAPEEYVTGLAPGHRRGQPLRRALRRLDGLVRRPLGGGCGVRCAGAAARLRAGHARRSAPTGRRHLGRAGGRALRRPAGARPRVAGHRLAAA